MDNKERQLFNFYYNKFAERRFDEKDVFGFLSFAIKYTENNRVMKELGNFIVHRENTTGQVQAFFEDCKQIIDNLNQRGNRKIYHLFSFKEIRNDFNALLSEIGFEKLSPEVMNDFVLCIISLLQDVKLMFGNKEMGHLSFAASSKELFLMGNMKAYHNGRYIPVTFPVLSVKNMYETIKPQDHNDTPYLFDHAIVEIMNIDGRLVITFPTLS